MTHTADRASDPARAVAGATPNGRVRPARPHTGVLPDGRRRREVLSYTRRGGRLTPQQAAAWERRAGQWTIPDDAVDDPAFDLHGWFGREAPLIVEIGSGTGAATAQLAAARPSYNVLALEVWRPGVAQALLHLERTGATNVRLLAVDALWSLTHLLGPASVSELWTFFPDPWPKARHHRRRLVDPACAALVGSRLVPGGRWRLATDWPAYAEQMRAVLDAEPALANEYDGPAPRWEDRPVTKFERRGLAAGRPVTDLCYRAVGGVTGAGPASI